MKKTIFQVIAVITLVLCASAAYASYPERNINGIIMWGAGGVMDSVSRAIAPVVEKELGRSIIMQNKTGASGAIAATFVKNAKPDGYNILFGAENPNIYKIMGLSMIDYDEYEPIYIMMSNVAVVVTGADSPYRTYKDFIEAAAVKRIKLGSTGPGGLPYVATSMIRAIHKGIEFNLVQFDGEGPAITALMGGHIDVFPVSLVSAAEFIKGGKLRALAIMDERRSPNFKDVPTVIEAYGEYQKYLPWGAFYGAFVRKDTPADIIDKLKGAFAKAYKDPKFTDFMERTGGIPVGLTGDAAKQYIARNKSVACWLMQNAGAAKKSPAEFGIPEPK